MFSYNEFLTIVTMRGGVSLDTIFQPFRLLDFCQEATFPCPREGAKRMAVASHKTKAPILLFDCDASRSYLLFPIFSAIGK